MHKLTKIFLATTLTAFGGMQLVPVERTNPPAEDDIRTPPDVNAILRRSCYDCHSHETRWPWYAHVAPVSWLVAKDVREGREAVNFSLWRQGEQEVDEIVEEVKEGEMPMKIYLLTHGDAKVNEAEVKVLEDWLSNGAPTGVELEPAP
jgi:Haem-binding domain